MKEKILKVCLVLMAILISLISIFVMPRIASIMADSLSSFSFLKLPGLILIYLSLIPFYISIFHAWKLIDLVYVKEIFSDKALKSLSVIKKSSFIIFLLYFIALGMLILLRVPFTTAYLTITILSLAALSFSISLSIVMRLVKVAKAYKDENELTI